MSDGTGRAGPAVVLVVARADNGVIGAGGGLPWHLPDDLKRFKALTMGKPMVMGRRTFDSLPRLLPGRRHIVLTRDATWKAAGAEVSYGVPGAMRLVGDVPEVAVIGGAEIFALFMSIATRIELTELHRSPAGEVRMPPLGSGWRSESRTMGGPDFDFVTLVREAGPARSDERDG